MTNSIGSVTSQPVQAMLPGLWPPPTKGVDGGDGGFQELLIQSLQQGASGERQAQLDVLESLTGGDVTQIEALASLKKADLTLRLMLQIRNKMLDAYQQIQQMRL